MYTPVKNEQFSTGYSEFELDPKNIQLYVSVTPSTLALYNRAIRKIKG